MLYAIYIAAAAVIGVLIGLTTLSVAVLQRNVTKNIRARTKDLIASYDTLLEKKSRELQILQQTMEELKSRPEPKKENFAAPSAQAVRNESAGSVLKTVEQIGTAAYRDTAAGEIYRDIKENFSYAPADVAKKYASPSAGKGPAGRLLEELSFETVYALSSLPSAQQEQILRETLSAEGKELLESYCLQKKNFRMLEFYDYLKAKEWEEPQQTKVHVSPLEAAAWKNTPGVEVVADRGICEGYQVEKDHVLHDFSIRTRELS